MFRKELDLATGECREILQRCYRDADGVVVVLDATDTPPEELTAISDEEAVAINEVGNKK